MGEILCLVTRVVSDLKLKQISWASTFIMPCVDMVAKDKCW